MNDDTDKLAAQMQNLKPSKSSRKAGLEAAMAAFNTEFARETCSIEEKMPPQPKDRPMRRVLLENPPHRCG